jgi:hypothetical protein
MEAFFNNKALKFCIFVMLALILIFLFHLVRESLNKENSGKRKLFRKGNYKGFGFSKAKYWGIPIYFNNETNEMIGRSALSEMLSDIFIWIDVNIVICEGFKIILIKEKEGECTNSNPYVHQGSGEREGCIQNCNECSYNSENISDNSKNIK